MERAVLKVSLAVCCAVMTCVGQWVSAAESGDDALTEKDGMDVEVCEICHEKQYEAIRSTAHWMTGDPRTPARQGQCAACHGDLLQHVENEGEGVSEGLKALGRRSMMPAEEQNAVCVSCHKEASLLHWQGSGHDIADVGCVACHRVHQADRVRSRETEADVCYTCHADLRAQFQKPYGHPVRQGKMSCSDCHGSHGGVGEVDLKAFSINEVCYDCHAEKRGPFLWEHAPASENCVLCHNAHGAIHRGALSRRQPQLCQSCHEPTAIANNPAGPHARHSRLALSYRTPGAPDIGPAIGGRGISRLVMAEGCSNCHNKVHGSNHPAGANLMR
jgi:DmsE family decaheme c-type cytochrome